MVLDTETINKLAENLKNEFTDPMCVAYNMAWGGAMYFVIDNSGIDNAIENAVNALPLTTPTQSQVAANAMTYAVVRVAQKAFEKTMGE